MMRADSQSIFNKLTNRVTVFSAIAVLFIGSLGTILPLLPILHVSAAPTVITQLDMGDWTTYMTTGGTVEFVDEAGAPAGAGAAKLITTSDNNSRARLTTDEFEGVALDDVTQASYWSKVESASNIAGSVSYSITIDVDGDLSTAGDRTSLNYEPYWQNGGSPDPAPVVHGVWQEWDVADGLFWSSASVGGFTAGAGGPPFYSLGDAKTIAPSAKVVAIATYVGSYNPSYVTYVDLVSFNGTEYDFERGELTPPTAATQTTQTVLQSDFANTMDAWTYHSDNTEVANPNPTANHEVVANPVVTPGDNGAVRLTSADGDRWNLASLQYSGTKLSDIAALGFRVYTNAPGKAYINLDVDFNHPGLSGWQGRLVYVPSGVTTNTWSSHEAVASNGQWQWSRMITNAESVWPDGHTNAERSWNDIITAFPDARITAIDNAAFGSLYLRADGPSVTHYDQVYLATATENIKYNFEIPDTEAPLVEITSPVNDGVVRGSVNVTGTVTDDTALSHWVISLHDGSVDLSDGQPHQSTRISVPGWGQTNTSSNNVNFTKTLNTTSPSLADGEYQIRLAARDAAGNRDLSDPSGAGTSSVHVIGITVDNTRPVATLVSPDIGSYNPTSIVVDATDNVGLSKVTANLYDETGAVLLDSCSETITPSGVTSYTLTCPVSGLADGVYTIKANAQDRTGYTSNTINRQFTVDSNAPAVVIVAPEHNSTHDTNFMVTVSANDFLSGLERVRVRITRVGHGGVVDCSETGLGGLNNYTVDCPINVAALPNGTYIIRADARDLADNQVAEVNRTFFINKPEAQPVFAPLPAQFVPAAANADAVEEIEEADEEIVLGLDSGEDDNGQVQGDTFSTVSAGSTSFFGLGWWWLAILATLAAALWWFIAARRRRNSEA